ncbi:MAG TPA: LytTR family DNA-binding domain-containing protein [Paludibacter sp.]
MQENLKRNLNLFLPRLFTLKYGWQCFWGVCAYTLVMLNFQHPFGEYTSNKSLHHCIYCAFGGLYILLLALIYLVFPRLFKNYYQQSNWTRGKELRNLLLLYILSLLSNWVCVVICFSPIHYNLTFYVQILSFSFTFNVLPVIVANFIHQRYHWGWIKAIPKQTEPLEEPLFFQCINKMTIPITDILYIFQDSNYQFIRYESEGKVHEEKERRSMKKLLSIMEPYPQFKSCHESFLINTDKIEFVNIINGKKKLKLKGIDTPLNISNQYRNDFNQFLQSKK